MHPCCAASRAHIDISDTLKTPQTSPAPASEMVAGVAAAATAVAERPAPSETAREGMVYIPGGEFLMGTDDKEGFPADGEGPIRRVRVKPFLIDRTTVTNAQFAEFVQKTGYKTEAERFG